MSCRAATGAARPHEAHSRHRVGSVPMQPGQTSPNSECLPPTVRVRPHRPHAANSIRRVATYADSALTRSSPIHQGLPSALGAPGSHHLFRERLDQDIQQPQPAHGTVRSTGHKCIRVGDEVILEVPQALRHQREPVYRG